MKRLSALVLLAAGVLAGSSAVAQENTGWAPSAGATGETARQSEKTSRNSGSFDDGAPIYDRSSAPGSTQSTRTKGYLGNSGGLTESGTGLVAPDSVDGSGVGGANYSLGFPNLPAKPYGGPYQGSGKFGGVLPPTSTGDVNIDTTGNRNEVPSLSGKVPPVEFTVPKVDPSQVPPDDEEGVYTPESWNQPFNPAKGLPEWQFQKRKPPGKMQYYQDNKEYYGSGDPAGFFN